MKREQSTLKEGFTTGSAAAAAAKAAVLAVLQHAPATSVEIPLPSPHGFIGRLCVPLASATLQSQTAARASVIKDGGDDPDATHGASICCSVVLHPDISGGAPKKTVRVRIEGGQGIGRVTLPGLPMPPGFAAINPMPRRQIALAVAEGLATGEGKDASSRNVESVDVLVEIPAGAMLARKTMNARLGIVGGLSVLGTSGIVKPFSHASWRATVESGLDVAKAAGLNTVCLCTGRRSEALAQKEMPHLPEQAFVQMADLFSHALHHAASRGFARIIVSCYGGKLAKMAQGMEHTHADSGRLDFASLAALCHTLGMHAAAVEGVRQAVTARRVFDLARDAEKEVPLARELAQDALRHAYKHLDADAALELLAFDADDRLLVHAVR